LASGAMSGVLVLLHQGHRQAQDEWSREKAISIVEFAKVLFALVCGVGVPLLLEGLAGGGRVGWIVAGAAGACGVAVWLQLHRRIAVLKVGRRLLVPRLAGDG